VLAARAGLAVQADAASPQKQQAQKLLMKPML
jgi:hypothetical protein